jgi:type I restriction enzyme R subunit
MKSNFDFLKENFENLYKASVQAENTVYRAPRTSCMYARRALELTVKSIYHFDNTFNAPYQDTLSAMMHEYDFKKNLDPGLFPRINLIRKLGNLAIHSDSKITKYESLKVLRNLFDFLNWFVIYYSKEDSVHSKFNEKIIPFGEEHDKKSRELQELEEKLQKQDSKREDEQFKLLDENSRLKTELERAIQQIQVEKPTKKEKAKEYAKDPNEAETRAMYIDLMLREAGWDPKGENVEEYEVSGMPNPQGRGWVDYVLWGNDGKPLGLVEAKKTTVSPKKGKHQAKLYADCLEQEFGQRPVIFYSNGFETWLWDDSRYPSRSVYGFYTKDQLQLLINRRITLESIASPSINRSIAGGNGRVYQELAIKRVCEHFEKGHRKSLLVMATGSGKTRVSVAIVDLLTKANWAKRILFLADRNALVTQAKNSYNEHLPNLSGVDLTKEKEDDKSRIVFSTYPTMMNAINHSKIDRTKRFGVGYFDLIIIDEAHRSVYQKYQEIFEYFDSMILGLTATPKEDVDRNTYQLFDLETGVPTFAYDLEEAVEDGFLVPPKAIEVPIKFQDEGIKYSELSEEEQDEYEATFRDNETGEIPEEIGSSALNRWLFNHDTVDKVLDYVMENGLKIAGGEKLGKTIIFASNQKHADFIEERFDIKYPQFKGDYLKVVTHGRKYAHDIIDKFKTKGGKKPYIAVSVDMLDTGIDVPDILNLVFLKKIRSKAKFWQMIGRGTRLCRDIFGPGKDKECFLVFDFCGNFEFFDEHPDGFKSNAQDSISKRIFKRKVKLIKDIQDSKFVTDEKFNQFRKELINSVYDEINVLDQNSFIVRPHLKYLHKYLNKDVWNNLSNMDVIDINEHLSGLTIPKEEDEFAIRFDLLILELQDAIFNSSSSQENLKEKIFSVSENLEKKLNIPSVAEEKETIRRLQDDNFWEGINVHELEPVRKKLRSLIKFIDRNKAYIDTYTNFQDSLGEASVRDGIEIKQGLPDYRKKIEKFVRENPHNDAVNKIKQNLSISKDDVDELSRIALGGEVDDFKKTFSDQKELVRFIRKTVGLDKLTVQKKFSKFLDQNEFNADQINFIKLIIDNISRNGLLDPEDLYENPFTYIHFEGIDGLFEEQDREEIFEVVGVVNQGAVYSQS